MRKWSIHFFSAALISTCLLVRLTCASVGDRSPAYQRCLATCISLRCDSSSPLPSADSASSSSPPSSDSLSLAAFTDYDASLLWSCPATCSYACQQILTDLSLSLSPTASTATPSALEGLPVGKQVQFHGKWPFHRLDFSHLVFPFFLLDYFLPRCQEPLSVLFSVGNLWAHYQGYTTLRSLSRGGGQKGARTVEGRRLSKVYLVYAMSGLNAWISSIWFHTRDNAMTEKLDYFGAGLTTLIGLWVCIMRISGWYQPTAAAGSSTTQGRGKHYRSLITATFSMLYLLHVSYLSLRPRFDYSYNMKINILVSLVTIVFWLYWIFVQSTLPTPSNFSRRQLSSYPSARTRFRAPHHLDPLLPLVVLPLLTLFEVLDFAPVGFGTGLRLLDSHSLWHLSTIWVVRWWYQFLVRDVRWIDGQGDPPTAANAVQRGKDTPAVGIGGGFKGTELRRGTLRDGMLDFGLGLLEKYNVGLRTKKFSSTSGSFPTSTTSERAPTQHTHTDVTVHHKPEVREAGSNRID